MNSAEAEAFEAFARPRLPELLRFAHALTADDQAAADLVQGALVNVAARWARLSEIDNLDGYVRRVMINLRNSWWRRLRREYSVADVPELPARESSTDQAIWALLAGLPPRQCTILALRYGEDMSEKQVADTLGCSIGNVKSQASRGLSKLREALQQEREALFQ